MKLTQNASRVVAFSDELENLVVYVNQLCDERSVLMLLMLN